MSEGVLDRPDTSDRGSPVTGEVETHDSVERFRECIESVFTPLFAGALFDQVALPSVAAGVEATGRARYEPFGRAARTAASEQLVYLADEQVRQGEADRLFLLHRDVKGLGYNGVRYSALNPESWNWILYSTFLMHLGACQAISGVQFSAADEQAVWDYYRQLSEPIQLSGQGRLPDTYVEMLADYESIVRERCEPNITLDGAASALRRPLLPESLPLVVRKILLPVPMAVAAEALCVLGFGTIHPEVRSLMAVRWTRRHQIEYRLLTGAIQVAHRYLPRRLTITPMARNRRQYERLVAKYQGIGLTSFAPDAGARRCPMG